MPTCSECRSKYGEGSGRPDCDKENPEYDGTCPRRLYRPDRDVVTYLFLGRMFLEHKVLPSSGGLFDQDYRFILAVMVLSEDTERALNSELNELVSRLRGFEQYARLSNWR